MSEAIQLEVARRKAVPEVVAACERLLRLAKDGDIRLLIWCAAGPDATEMHYAGEPFDTFHMIGCMERMKLDYWRKVLADDKDAPSDGDRQ